jgi:hypothetical protein
MTENLFRQNIIIKDRNCFEADKIEEVLAFDETSVVLSSGSFEVIVGGTNLTIVSLDSEKKTITIKGKIDAVIYGEKTTKKGVFSKFFG